MECDELVEDFDTIVLCDETETLNQNSDDLPVIVVSDVAAKTKKNTIGEKSKGEGEGEGDILKDDKYWPTQVSLNEDVESFIKKEEKKFQMIATESTYSIYKKPTTSSEHVQNIISATFQKVQTKESQKEYQTKIYGKYHSMKQRNFPLDEMKEMLDEAYGSLPKKNKQIKIESFFTKVPQNKNKSCDETQEQSRAKKLKVEDIRIFEDAGTLEKLGQIVGSEKKLNKLDKVFQQPFKILATNFSKSANDFQAMLYVYNKTLTGADKNSEISKQIRRGKDALQTVRDNLDQSLNIILVGEKNAEEASFF